MIKLRPWEKNDIQYLGNVVGNKEITALMKDSFPTSLEQAVTWIENMSSQALAIEYDGKVVGGVEFYRKPDVYRMNAEIDFWLSEEYWNNGIMTDALNLFIDHIFSLGDFIRIYCYVTTDNFAAISVLEKCGFNREGRFEMNIVKDKHLYSSYSYAILKEN